MVRMTLVVAGFCSLVVFVVVGVTWVIQREDGGGTRPIELNASATEEEPALLLPTPLRTFDPALIRRLDELISSRGETVISVRQAGEALGWIPLCSKDHALAWERSFRQDQRLLLEFHGADQETVKPQFTVVQQPRFEGLEFIPAPFETQTINGFKVEFSKWGERYDARFLTGQIDAEGRGIVAAVTAREIDFDEFRSFVDTLTFECR